MNNLLRNYEEQPLGKLETPLEDDLRYLYFDLGMTIAELSKYFNKGTSSVSRWLQKYNIKRADVRKEYVKLTKEEINQIDISKLSRDFLKQPWKRGETPIKSDFEYLYLTLCMSANAVATYLSLSPDRVLKIITSFGLNKNKEQHNKSREKEVQRKYNVSHISQLAEVKAKVRKTCQDRYNVTSPLSLKENREDAMEAKYGEKHALNISEFKKKQEDSLERTTGVRSIKNLHEEAKEAVSKKYGVDNVFKLPEIQTKARESFKKKYGVDKYAYLHIKHMDDMNKEFWLENFVDKRHNTFDVSKCATYHNVQCIAVRKKLAEFGINLRHKWSSIQEVNISNVFTSVGVPCVTKDRKLINPLELDVVSYDKKLAIEYDGLLYHSQGISSNSLDYEVSENYHLDKTNKCESVGFQLLHIFENEWMTPIKHNIWESVIKSKLGVTNRVYARKTTVRKINDATAREFCELNHLQGGIHSTHNYGLYYDSALVAVMTFGKARYNKSYDWELLRFCTLSGTTVIGGASKLLKAFRTEFSGSIISYANRRWSNGNLYKKLGFTLTGTTRPSYFYFKTRDNSRYPADYTLHNRVRFQKHKLSDILEHFDPEMTELENMYLNGYRTIYDCGNFVFTLVD